MTTAIEPRQNGAARAVITPDAPMTAAELALMQGDLSKLTSEDRLNYYRRVCESLGLNPLTRPFDYLTLNGKSVLYARKDATDQLRTLRKVAITDVKQETVGDLFVVTVKAALPDGRSDMEIGAVSITGLKGEGLANAMMKAITKAKRRVTLSLCGLGWLDETEVDTIPGARAEVIDLDTGEVIEAAPQPEPQPQRQRQQQAQPKPKGVYDWDSEAGQALREIAKYAQDNGIDGVELSHLCVEWLERGPKALNIDELQHLGARLVEHVQGLEDAERIAAAASTDEPPFETEPAQQGLGV